MSRRGCSDIHSSRKQVSLTGTDKVPANVPCFAVAELESHFYMKVPLLIPLHLWLLFLRKAPIRLPEVVTIGIKFQDGARVDEGLSETDDDIWLALCGGAQVLEYFCGVDHLDFI